MKGEGEGEGEGGVKGEGLVGEPSEEGVWGPGESCVYVGVVLIS